MKSTLPDEALNQIFHEARTHSVWLDKPVDDDLLRRVYDLAKMGPTSANMCPMRIVFVKSKEAKEKLKPCLDAGNVGAFPALPGLEGLTVLVDQDPAGRRALAEVRARYGAAGVDVIAVASAAEGEDLNDVARAAP